MKNNTENKEMCFWFDRSISVCSLNDSTCYYPFSKEGCQIQCEEIFKEEPNDLNSNRYVPDDSEYSNKIFTRIDAFKEIGLQKGMLIADWFIPYSDIDMMAVSPSAHVKYGIDMVKQKITESNCHVNRIGVYYNVKVAEVIGIYILGVGTRDDQKETQQNDRTGTNPMDIQ